MWGSPVVPVTPQVESDDSLRKRLLYIAGDSEQVVARILRAGGAQLDDIAESYGLGRRNIPKVVVK